MCGRYSSTQREVRALERELELRDIRLTPRFNIAPTQRAPIVALGAQGRPEVQEFRWGLVPSWSKTDKEGARLINARSETVATLPSFRSAFKARRCLVIADGFYEWIQSTKPKQPVRFTLHDPDMPMIMAGIWESWRSAADPEHPLKTFSILTTTPNEVAAQVHDRMPVILPPECWPLWMDPATPPADLQAMLKPCEAAMAARWVTPAMNNARFEDPAAVQPISQDRPPEPFTLNSS